MKNYPDDLKEVVKNYFNDDDLTDFINSSASSLFKYHFSLGMMLRNYYKLWVPENIKKYSDDIWMSADDMSFEFIKKINNDLKLEK